MNSNKKVTRDASYFQSSGALLLASGLNGKRIIAHLKRSARSSLALRALYAASCSFAISDSMMTTR
jgi:hypothetical protein